MRYGKSLGGWEVDFGERARDVAEMITDIHPDEDDSDAGMWKVWTTSQ